MKILISESQFKHIINEINVGLLMRAEELFRGKSGLHDEVTDWYIRKFVNITGINDEKILDYTWDDIKKEVDSFIESRSGGDDLERRFIDSFNLLSQNENNLECAYIWGDEEEDVQDALITVTKSMIKDSSLLDKVPQGHLNSLLKFLLKLHRKGSMILYRALYVKDDSKIKYSDLGTHYTWTSKVFNKHFLDYLWGFPSGDPELSENDLYVVKVLTPTTNIDYPATLWANMCFGSAENEVTLLQQKNIKVLSVKKISIPAGTPKV